MITNGDIILGRKNTVSKREKGVCVFAYVLLSIKLPHHLSVLVVYCFVRFNLSYIASNGLHFFQKNTLSR